MGRYGRLAGHDAIYTQDRLTDDTKGRMLLYGNYLRSRGDKDLAGEAAAAFLCRDATYDK